MNLNQKMFAKMREMTRLLQAGPARAVTSAIQRTLQATIKSNTAAFKKQAQRVHAERAKARSTETPNRNRAAPEVDIFADLVNRMRSGLQPGAAGQQQPVDVTGNGEFLTQSCSNQAGTRAYKLFIPASYKSSGKPFGLIVMLHGCKQNPDDFAAGTRMNALAVEKNYLVAYPAQSQNANGSNCWNWFQPGDQQRDQGEPSIIADLTRKILRDYRIDARRVYIAGLSAGGAMAAIVGDRYPELFAAVGVHSGLAAGAADDLQSALMAMKSGSRPGANKRTANNSAKRMPPVIVFHGDRDRVVHPRNGDQVLEQFVAQIIDPDSKARPDTLIRSGPKTNGRSYTHSIQHDANGKAIAEHWLIHGALHAWSGGDARGSYTDPNGPNASAEMLRFFELHGGD